MGSLYLYLLLTQNRRSVAVIVTKRVPILTRKQTHSENGKVTPTRNHEMTVKNQPQQPNPVLSSLTVHSTHAPHDE